MAKVALIISDLSLSNLGDYAIFLSLRDKLQKDGFSNIYKLSTRKKYDDEVSHVSWKNIRELIVTIRKADNIFFGGGGIIQDESSFSNLLYYAGMAFLCRLLNKKYSLISVGVTHPRHKLSALLMASIINNANKVTVRDKASLEVLGSVVNKKAMCKISVVQDLVFSFNFSEKDISEKLIKNKLKPGILLAPRPLLDGINSNIYFYKKLAKQVDIIAKKLGLPVYLLPFQACKDNQVCLELHHLLNSQSTILYDVSPNDVFYLSRLCKISIFMRLHAGIIGHIAKSNIYGLSYSSKITDFMDEIGLLDHHFKINDVDSLSDLIL